MSKESPVLEKQKGSFEPKGRNLVLVSGYYGFGNLGDEAILEVLLSHLSRIVPLDKIVVLSNCPKATMATYGVRAVHRFDLGRFYSLLQEARLFVSGGGGLFQDVSSLKSVFYYSALHHLARLAGVPICVYAQGIGPLNSEVARLITRRAFEVSDHIAVRDQNSFELLEKWNIEASLTADPVWCLEPHALPGSISEALESARIGNDSLLVGLSLRECAHLGASSFDTIYEIIEETLPPSAVLVPLILQENQDTKYVNEMIERWQKKGNRAITINSLELTRPSNWLALIKELDLVIGMRLHSLIMALSASIPVIGLAYDPKVEIVMKEFDQPFLNLINNPNLLINKLEAKDIFNNALVCRQENLQALNTTLSGVRQSACMNMQFMDRILSK